MEEFVGRLERRYSDLCAQAAEAGIALEREMGLPVRGPGFDEAWEAFSEIVSQCKGAAIAIAEAKRCGFTG